jgi:hypothetical protein
MAVVLAYVDAVPGRLYPLVATLLDLAHRGHRVAVRCGIGDVERLRSLGLDASLLRPIPQNPCKSAKPTRGLEPRSCRKTSITRAGSRGTEATA